MYNLLKHLLFHIRSILSIIQPISALNPNIESVQKFDWVKSLVRRKYNGQKKSSLYNYEYDSHNSSFTFTITNFIDLKFSIALYLWPGGGRGDIRPPPLYSGRGSPLMNLEFFSLFFRIASQFSMLIRERNPSAKQDKYLS